MDDPFGDVEPADPVALAQDVGELEDRGEWIEADARVGDEVGELLGDQLDVASLVVPGDDRRRRLAASIEEHPGLGDAGDPKADDAVIAAFPVHAGRRAALGETVGDDRAHGIGEDAGVHLDGLAIDDPRRSRPPPPLLLRR